MKRIHQFSLATLALAIAATAHAQAPKVSGLVQVWWVPTVDKSLRQNSSTDKYYNLRSEFKETGFSIRRSELKFSGNITDGVKYEVMIDPSKSSDILQDAAIELNFGAGFGLKAGQFKNLQTMEGLTSSSELITVERSQMGRVFGDDRQRGLALGYTFGDPKEFGGKAQLAYFNGSGRANDNNECKDIVGRLEFSVNNMHTFGGYFLQGNTDKKHTRVEDLQILPFKGYLPASADPTLLKEEIRSNKDKTSNMGLFYAFRTDSIYASFEAITGLLGRRYASLADKDVKPADLPTAAAREHMDQKFQGYVLTGAYTFANHTFLARYDMMNYNQGDKWYTPYNPYTESAPGVPRSENSNAQISNVDYTPKYTEITFGYMYAWKPEKVKAANLKLNYIIPSKNFLKPFVEKGVAGNVTGWQTGEQGANTLVLALQVAF